MSHRRDWLLWMAFAISLAFVNPYVRGDGNGYYAWLVSPVIDRDLDFANQYRQADPFFKGMMFDAGGRPRAEQLTVTGRLGDQWSVGPAVLWSPWFLAAHGAVTLMRQWRPDLAADGYTWPYRYACAIGTAVYGFLALLLARRAADLLGLARSSTTAMLVVWAASPLPVYQYFLPFHVHALAAFTVSWFVYKWLRIREPRNARTPEPQNPGTLVWLQWGAIAGLMTEVYQLNAVLLVLAIDELTVLARRAGWRRALAAASAFAGAGLVVWVPQLVGKAIVYGTPFTTGYRDQFFWLSPRLWQTAFSTEHGLFSWTPVAIAGVAGLAAVLRRRHDLWPLGAAAALFFVSVASYQNWHGQSAFGNRFFVSLAVVGVIGVAELWTRARAAGAPALAAAGVAAVALTLWNAGLAFQWGTDIIPNRGPVDFGAVARNQMTVVPSRTMRFLRLYFTSRDATAREIERRGLDDSRPYKVVR